jgi:hypothetical protein
MHLQYIRGQWNAFDRILTLLNTIDVPEDISADKMRRRIYHLVFDMKPKE